MSGTSKWRLMPILAALALFLAACGAETATVAADGNADAVTTTVAEEHSDDEADHEEAFTFGKPADAADADRVIEIDANDDFTFGPEAIEVTAGEIITFVITNTGNLPHDFTLGDDATQDAHEAEMAEMAGMTADDEAHGDANAVIVAAGETAELTWHFSESGSLLMGCHQPGHYAAGMKGAIKVEA